MPLNYFQVKNSGKCFLMNIFEWRINSLFIVGFIRNCEKYQKHFKSITVLYTYLNKNN